MEKSLFQEENNLFGKLNSILCKRKTDTFSYSLPGCIDYLEFEDCYIMALIDNLYKKGLLKEKESIDIMSYLFVKQRKKKDEGFTSWKKRIDFSIEEDYEYTTLEELLINALEKNQMLYRYVSLIENYSEGKIVKEEFKREFVNPNMEQIKEKEYQKRGQ